MQHSLNVCFDVVCFTSIFYLMKTYKPWTCVDFSTYESNTIERYMLSCLWFLIAAMLYLLHHSYLHQDTLIQYAVITQYQNNNSLHMLNNQHCVVPFEPKYMECNIWRQLYLLHGNLWGC